MCKATILMVEDDAILAMDLQRMISQQGYTVLAPLASGEEAITFLLDNQVDLVLMDIELAGDINGIRTAEILHQTSDVPIVFLTGFSHDPLLEQAKIAAPYGYLIKPVPERELAATLEMALHRHSLDRQLQKSRLELQKSEEKYRQLVENSPLGIFRTTLSGRALAVNAEMARIVGCVSPEEAIADFTDLADQFYVDPQRRQQLITQLKAEGAVQHFEFEGRKKNGETLWISMNARLSPTDAANGHSGEMVIDGFAIDITELKRSEEEKRVLTAQLQQAQKMEAIGTLAGGIAHDFNNILGAIVGYAEMIRDDFPVGSPGIHNINQVLKASFRAKDLVKQILTFSRQVEGQKNPIQPALIIKEAITLLHSSLPTTITINQDIAADVGMVLADPIQIHQIVINLCTNAFHAMEAKGGTLTISLRNTILCQDDLATEPDLQPGTFVQLSIRDSGEGISPEIREKIFDPFFTTKEVGKGTGLGLSMVYSIVKNSGGSIACDSRVGEGTEFRILLPTVEDRSGEESGSTDLIAHGKGHILLIDDEEMLVEFGQIMLERLGYQVTIHTSSLKALATFQSDPHGFDAVITDQTMPGMTGLDLARRMLQIRPELPIILCTGYSKLVDEAEAKAYGIKGFVMKPLTQKEIADLLREVLSEAARTTPGKEDGSC